MTEPPSMQPLPPSAEPPTWFKAFVVGCAACAPGGLLFLFALITDSNVNFPEPVWYALALGGGVLGWFAQRSALQG